MALIGGCSSIVVHHSASARTLTLEQIDAQHRAKGWAGVGYHFVIEGEGRVRVGRPLPRQGAHCEGHNGDTIGVCVVGDNTREAHRWAPVQVASLREVVRALRVVFPTAQVCGHRALRATQCPGLSESALATLLGLG